VKREPKIYVVQDGKRILAAEPGLEHVADARPDCMRCGRRVDEMRVTVASDGALVVTVECHDETTSLSVGGAELLKSESLTVGPCFAASQCACPVDEAHTCGRDLQ
jgi:hypothetical protein